MQINKIGIIGNGFVGNGLYQNFKIHFQTLVYDKIEEKSLNSYEDVINCDFIFVCLPTPMKTVFGGECNLSILKQFFSNLPDNLKGVFVIKSTMPVGTTKIIQEMRKDLKIIHNPEFLTARNAVEDFKMSERHVIGGDMQISFLLKNILEVITPDAKIIFTSSDESEAIKYFANTFLATKVAYFNLIYDLSLNLNMNYDNIIAGICSDSRIGESHTRTPGPDGDRGFGGTCFPKDINALINILDKNNVNSSILKEVWKYNKLIRSNWDWADNTSAVYNGESK